LTDAIPKRTFWQKLKNKYRLVIMNDNTYEEIVSYRLSRMNLYILFSSLAVTLVSLTVVLVVFTPLKEYIPGYGDINSRREIMDLQIRADSLEQVVTAHNLYIKNINNIVNGNVSTETPAPPPKSEVKNYDTINLRPKSDADAELRHEMESKEKFSVSSKNMSVRHAGSIADFYFFSPVKGTISSLFNPVISHFGIDIVTPKNEPVKAVLDGKVIFSDWTLETGYTLSIQHTNNLISTYKHNSVLFKKVGNFVAAGDVIAIVGNTGELSNGPHLHFELWYNGIAVNPKEFINFN
jgi:murein DD-endopeptidase MepM/ murein hydrolase activator NlpD